MEKYTLRSRVPSQRSKWSLSHELRKLLVKTWLYFFCILMLLGILYLYNITIADVIVSLFLVVIASFSKIYKRFTSASVGFELVTPITILFAYTFGVVIALILALVMLVLAALISGKVDGLSIGCEMITYAIISLFAAILSGVSFVPLCLVLIIMRNVIIFPLGFYLMGRNPAHLFIIVLTDIIFNFWVVLSVGASISSIL